MDIGNSRIKWSCQSADGLGEPQAAVYTKADAGACLDERWKELNKPEQIWVANVAGKTVADQLQRWTLSRWGIAPRFAEVTESAGGVRNAYAEISQLGVDRWLALIAAWRKYGSAACIVGCGTAVTIDGLDGAGRHLGGLILPGVAMMQQSLYQTASGIPAAAEVTFKRGLADNTGQGVLTGCTMAVVSLIDRVVDELMNTTGSKLVCVITGGSAGEILPLLQARFTYAPLLVLEGLAFIAGGKP